ncbi:hypothetical protein MMA15_07330 [Streptomyces sp. M600PL45_2]|uniref:Uncharacterized protein n=1 Tax=Streptomyces marispadix TaxID=2922868 RepID=A0ABS9SVL2_9ACTN|nr:hypothetical protein [Streptomyces marispadix]MCH6160238.1 hypothetical protein [Streptomyces marispadix]
MTDVRHILVLPDRDSAEEVAEELKHRYELARRGDGSAQRGDESARRDDEPVRRDEGPVLGDEVLYPEPQDEGPYPEPQLVREALAGEDDAEDAQWLVVLEYPAHATHLRGAPWDPESLDALAGEYDGWLERD